MSKEASNDLRGAFDAVLKKACDDLKVDPINEAMTVHVANGITLLAAPLKTRTDVLEGDFLWEEPTAVVYLDIPFLKERYPPGTYKVMLDRSLERADFVNAHGKTVFSGSATLTGTPTANQAAGPHSDSSSSATRFCVKFCWPVCCWGIRCVEICLTFTINVSTTFD